MKNFSELTRTEKRKPAVTVVCCILLLLLYIVIFCFSSQDGEESSNLSYRVSKSCVEVANTLSGGHWSISFRAQLAEYFEHPIRKLAHFTEYTCMGMLVYGIWVWRIPQRRRLFLLTVGWVFVSAAADEFHQLLVSGRSSSPLDVCLDTAGGIFGVLVIWCIQHILSRIKSRRHA